MLLGGDRTALTDIGVATMPQAKHLEIKSVEQLGQDLLITAAPKNGNN